MNVIDGAVAEIIIHPTILAIVYGVLDFNRASKYPHEDEMNIYLDQLDEVDHGIKCNIMIKDNVPREDVRSLHRDIRIPVPHPHRPVICNSLLALDPFTESNGATCVIKGSHKWNGELPKDAETIPVVMDAGSIMLFDGELWHGHLPNTTHDCYRRCLNLNYHYRWIKNFPNPQLDSNVWQNLPETIRAVI